MLNCTCDCTSKSLLKIRVPPLLFCIIVHLTLLYRRNAVTAEQAADFLLLLNSGIQRMWLSTMTSKWLPINNEGHVSSVDYDTNNDCVLWADNEHLEIRRQCFNPHREMELLHAASVGLFARIVYDWVSQMLYFTNMTHSRLEVISTASTPYRAQMHRTVVELDTDSNPCSGAHGCSHACIDAPNNTYKCAYPQGMQLIDGGRCTCPGSQVPLENGTCPSRKVIAATMNLCARIMNVWQSKTIANVS